MLHPSFHVVTKLQNQLLLPMMNNNSSKYAPECGRATRGTGRRGAGAGRSRLCPCVWIRERDKEVSGLTASGTKPTDRMR